MRDTDAPRPRWRSRTLWGWVLVVLGQLMVVDGVLLDLVLDVHLIDPGASATWSIAYAVAGAALVLAGCLLHLTADDGEALGESGQA